MFSAHATLLKRLKRWNHNALAVLVYVDIRQLRQMNRIASAEETDRLLESMTAAMAEWAGSDGISGRLWSKEFIAARAIDHPQSIHEFAEQLRERLQQLRFTTALGETEVAVSIGVVCNTPSRPWCEAIQMASDACQRAKARGLNQIVVHRADELPNIASTHTATMVKHFRELLGQGQLRLHLQPIMYIGADKPRLRKAEFLLRHETGGVVKPLPPGTIEAMEYFGLSVELDRYTCTAALEWMQENCAHLRYLHGISLNLSALSLADGRFIDSLYRQVQDAHLPPGKLCFEITETATVAHLDMAAEIITAFKSIGCRFSLDDFGSGACSFGYLQSLPVEEVKIDGRFIKEVASSPVSMEIVRAIHHVARATGKKTVAEFVDTPDKLDALQRIGIDYAQGWLFHPALPPERFLELLAE